MEVTSRVATIAAQRTFRARIPGVGVTTGVFSSTRQHGALQTNFALFAAKKAT